MIPLHFDLADTLPAQHAEAPRERAAPPIRPESFKFEKGVREREIATIALIWADKALTFACTRSGKCTEANPLYGRHPSALALIAGGAAQTVLYELGLKSLRGRPGATRTYQWIALAANGALVAYNVTVAF